MPERIPQAMEYLRAAQLHLKFGRHEKADAILSSAWKVYYNGLGMDSASKTDLLRFGTMARIAGVGATPETALARVRDAIERGGSWPD